MEIASPSPPERDNTAVLDAHKVIKDGMVEDVDASYLTFLGLLYVNAVVNIRPHNIVRRRRSLRLITVDLVVLRS